MLLQGCARPSARETTIFPFSTFSILFFPFFPSSLPFFCSSLFVLSFAKDLIGAFFAPFPPIPLLVLSSCVSYSILPVASSSFSSSSNSHLLYYLHPARHLSHHSSLTFVCFPSGYTPQSVPHHLSFAPPLTALIPHRRGARVLSLSVPFQVFGFFPWLFMFLFDFCLYLSFHSISSSRHHFSLRLLMLLLSRVTEIFVCLYIHLRSWANKTHLRCFHHLHSSLDT